MTTDLYRSTLTYQLLKYWYISIVKLRPARCELKIPLSPFKKGGTVITTRCFCREFYVYAASIDSWFSLQRVKTLWTITFRSCLGFSEYAF